MELSPYGGGGVSQGFNDSSTAHFAADPLDHIVREIIQNSLDAKDDRYDEPVLINMTTIDLNHEILGASELQKHIFESLQSTKDDNNKKGIEFYENALKVIKKAHIPTLSVIDENTTGLKDKQWDALVYKEGTPSKDRAAAGGSFGIGKNAPYLASDLGLVCYSTRYISKHKTEKFIARCKLVAHNNPENPQEMLQHIGFGTSKNEVIKGHYPPIIDDQISNEFKLNNGGTGIFIVGFNGEHNWEKKVYESAARSFFAAIHDKKLSITVKDTVVNNDTLNEGRFWGKENRQYYDLYKDSSKPILIDEQFGKFYLKIAVDDESMKNRIAYINRRGMLVTDEKSFIKNPFYSSISSGKYVAVVWAADDNTDACVRVMEPPTHESIEYKRIDHGRQSRVKEQLTKISQTIGGHIREKMGINPDHQSINLEEFCDIIPMMSDQQNDKPGNDRIMKPNENMEVKKKPIQGRISRFSNYDSNDDDDDAKNDDDDDDDNDKNKEPNKPKPKPKRLTKSNIKNPRIILQANVLRVAFDTITGTNKFEICPVGEEVMKEEPIKVSLEPNSKNNRLAKETTINDNIITVNSTGGSRVLLDLSVDKSLQYTGYTIIEYRTRRTNK